MTRVKRGIHARKKRRATLALAKGYRGDASRHYRVAKEAVLKADQYRYRDRRNRKPGDRVLPGLDHRHGPATHRRHKDKQKNGGVHVIGNLGDEHEDEPNQDTG